MPEDREEIARLIADKLNNRCWFDKLSPVRPDLLIQRADVRQSEEIEIEALIHGEKHYITLEVMSDVIPNVASSTS